MIGNQREYMFVVRKNPELSVNEIISYLKARGIDHYLRNYTNEYFIFDTVNLDPKKMSDQIGETLKIGRILGKVETDCLKKAFGLQKKRMNMKIIEEILESSLKLPQEVVNHASEANLIGVSVYPRNVADIKFIDFNELGEVVGEVVANRLKEDAGLKREPSIVTAKNFKYKESADIRPTEARKEKFHNQNLELLIGLENRFSYIAATLGICDQEAFNKRGIYRPNRPEGWIYGMAPNYAKALVNLSEVKKGDVLLDPFCGVGTILQEAVLNGIKVFGVDINKECVDTSRQNLKYVSKEYGLGWNNIDERIIVGDARKLGEYFKEDSFDAIVTEPYLGPAFKMRPEHNDAKRVISELKSLFKETLPEMNEIIRPGKRAVIISPSIKSSTGSLSLDLREMAEQNNFKILKSILDERPHQLVSREINILYKPNDIVKC